MKKNLIANLIAFLCFVKPAIALNDMQIQEFIENLGRIYVKPYTSESIKVQETDKGIEVKFPEFTIVKEQKITKNVATDEAVETYVKKTVEKIPGYFLNLVKNGTFMGYDQYHYSSTLIPRLQAIVFSYLKVANIKAGFFEETADLVPALGYNRNYSLKLNKFYFPADRDLVNDKEEMFSIDNLQFSNSTIEKDQNINVNSVFIAENTKMTSAHFNVTIPKIYYKTAMAEAIIEKGDFFPVMAKKISYIVKADDIFISIPLGSLNFGNIILQSELNSEIENNKTDILNAFSLSDIKVHTSMPVGNAPTDFTLKLSVNDLNYEKLVETQKKLKIIKNAKSSHSAADLADKRALGGFSEADENSSSNAQDLDKPHEFEQNNELVTMRGKKNTKMAADISELRTLFVQLMEKAKIRYSADIIFVKGSVKVVGNAKFVGEKLLNKMELKIVNFDEISPGNETKCRQELRANPGSFPAVCMNIGVLSSLRPYLNLNKRIIDDKGQTIDRFIVEYDGEIAKVNGIAVETHRRQNII